MGSSQTRVPNIYGIGCSRRVSTIISLYLRNGARYGHTDFGILIRSHICCIALYIALFPVTLSDYCLPEAMPFSTFCIPFPIFVTGGDRGFIFDR